jgi:hypothetical protein
MINIRFENNWKGGIMTGSVCLIKQNYIVRFSGKNKKFNKSFAISCFGCKENAYKAAMEYRDKISDENNLTTNRYRVIVENDYKYYEMQLKNGFIGKFDEEDLNIVLNGYKWRATKKNICGRYYMTQSGRKGQKYKSLMFHRLIFPHYTQIDHINRDGLDNRRKNLRPVSSAENNINQKKRKDNASGKTGVHFSNYRKCWVVQWPEDGKRKKKSFSISKYGNEGAKLLAINYRQKMDNKNGLMNGYESDEEVEVKINPVSIEHVKPIEKLLSTNKSGKTGVYYTENLTCKRPYRKWCREYRDKNGKKKVKNFFVGRKRNNAEAKKLAMEFKPPE